MPKTLSPTQYCNSRTARQNASYLYSPDGIGVYLLNGEYLSEKEMNERFPIKGKIRLARDVKHFKGDDIVTKRNWIH